MIDPIFIPHFSGDIGGLEKDISALQKVASDVRTTGADTHTTFQGLSACYEAPEAAQLFATTIPVRDKADHFADGLEKVKSALSEYAHEIRPIVKELDSLREQAVAFRAEAGDGDGWRKDQGKVDKNEHLIQAVTAAQEKFHAAERNAFNKITAVFGGPQLRQDDGTHQKGMYGYDPNEASKATKTPWGEVEGRKYEGVEAALHWTSDKATSLVQGFFVDGAWESLKGLGHLANFFDQKTFQESWKNLGYTVSGIGIYAVKPVDWILDHGGLEDKDSAYEIRSKQAAKEFGKSLIAYDEWDKNPTRAFGTVAFNALTLGTIPLLKAGKAGKAGVAAKTAGALGKVGLLVDPMTYARAGAGLGLKGAKLALPKVGELAAELHQKLGQLTSHADGIKYTTHDGKTATLDNEGNLRNADHDITDPIEAAKKEPSKHDLGNTQASAQADRQVYAHAGGGHGSAHNHPAGGGGQGAPHPGHATGSTGQSSSAHTEAGRVSGDDVHSPSHGNESLPAGAEHPTQGSQGPHQDARSGERHAGAGHGTGEENPPFERGGQVEQQIRDQLRRSGVKPGDLDRVLTNLEVHPAGKEVAEILASGRYTGRYGYNGVVASMSHANMIPGALDQFRLADRLHARGIHDVVFEAKTGYEIKPGIRCGDGTDLDVLARDSSGKTYGYQFKDIENPKSCFKRYSRT